MKFTIEELEIIIDAINNDTKNKLGILEPFELQSRLDIIAKIYNMGKSLL